MKSLIDNNCTVNYSAKRTWVKWMLKTTLFHGSQRMALCDGVTMALKALFNNVFTFKNLSCMSLHAISVFDKVSKWSLYQFAVSKASLCASKKWKKDKWLDLPFSFSAIDCFVRINHQSDSLLNGDIHYSVNRCILILDRDVINFKTLLVLAVYWSI